MRDLPTKHPTFILINSFGRSSMWTAKKYGLSMLPCLTPLVTENNEE